MKDEDVLPKDNHLGVEQIVQRNAPRALGAPERRAERDEPGAVTRAAACFLICHAKGVASAFQSVNDPAPMAGYCLAPECRRRCPTVANFSLDISAGWSTKLSRNSTARKVRRAETARPALEDECATRAVRFES